MVIVLHQAIGIEPMSGCTVPLGSQAGPHVHPGGVEPDEEWLIVAVCLVDEFQRRIGKLLVHGFHALTCQRAGIFNFAVRV